MNAQSKFALQCHPRPGRVRWGCLAHWCKMYEHSGSRMGLGMAMRARSTNQALTSGSETANEPKPESTYEAGDGAERRRKASDPARRALIITVKPKPVFKKEQDEQHFHKILFEMSVYTLESREWKQKLVNNKNLAVERHESQTLHEVRKVITWPLNPFNNITQRSVREARLHPRLQPDKRNLLTNEALHPSCRPHKGNSQVTHPHNCRCCFSKLGPPSSTDVFSGWSGHLFKHKHQVDTYARSRKMKDSANKGYLHAHGLKQQHSIPIIRHSKTVMKDAFNDNECHTTAHP